MPQPAHLPHVPRAQFLLQDAGDGEQRAGAEAVGQHLKHSAAQPRPVCGENAEQDEAEMADAGIGD